MNDDVINSSRVVFVVGGVHWLASVHLKSLKILLQRKHLSDAQVIVKTLSAGFHQNVDGMHRLTQVKSLRLAEKT